MANSGKIREVGSDGVTIEAATPASQPGDIFPSGVILQFAGSSAPTNWLICDGTAVSRTTFAALFAAIGTTYGAGNGSTTFNIPDMRGKMVVGKHSSGTFQTLGQTGGEENHTLLTAEMPAHSHGGASGSASPGTSADGSHAHNVAIISDGVAANAAHLWGSLVNATVQNQVTDTQGLHSHTVNPHTHSISVEGSGSTHNNMPPYFVVNNIIKT
jgi:microcystin-dependent protein